MALDSAIPIRSHLVLHSAFALFTRRFSLGLRTKNGLCGSRQVTAHFYYARIVRTEAPSDTLPCLWLLFHILISSYERWQLSLKNRPGHILRENVRVVLIARHMPDNQ